MRSRRDRGTGGCPTGPLCSRDARHPSWPSRRDRRRMPAVPDGHDHPAVSFPVIVRLYRRAPGASRSNVVVSPTAGDAGRSAHCGSTHHGIGARNPRCLAHDARAPSQGNYACPRPRAPCGRAVGRRSSASRAQPDLVRTQVSEHLPQCQNPLCADCGCSCARLVPGKVNSDPCYADRCPLHHVSGVPAARPPDPEEKVDSDLCSAGCCRWRRPSPTGSQWQRSRQWRSRAARCRRRRWRPGRRCRRSRCLPGA